MDRNTTKYLLKKRNNVVYVGITDDPDRREAEHRLDKDFDSMVKIGNLSSRHGAEQWESERIHQFMRNHEGRLPKYNKNTSGK